MSDIKDILEVTAEIPDDLLTGFYRTAHNLALSALKTSTELTKAQEEIEQLKAVARLQDQILSESSSTMRGNELRRELARLTT